MLTEVEIICIGNELLIGKIQNTNGHWIAKQVTLLGANVKRITIIQDTIEEIADAFNAAINRKPQYIISTGGLGPTFDDKTFQGIAKALGCNLELNPIAIEMVKQRIIEYAKKWQKPTETKLTQPRIKMAMFPGKTHPVINPVGTAPGLYADVNGIKLFSLPGVPVEMEAIFLQTIAPLIRQEVGQVIFCQRSLFVENIVESELAPLIDQVMAENACVYIKSHPMRIETKSYIELHLTTTTNQKDHPADKLVKAIEEIKGLICKNSGQVIIET